MADVVQLELFRPTPIDPPWRDCRSVMEFPFLALQKRRTEPIGYSCDRAYVEVHAPAQYGIATIWDWDVIIFAASHISAALESPSLETRIQHAKPRIAFAPHECLGQIGRGTSGRAYRELAQAIRRLRMTTIITNVRADDGAGMERPFSWLADYELPNRYNRSGRITPDDPLGEPDPSRPWIIELPDWLYQPIKKRRGILAMHRDYFGLTGGIERWLYRLARKAVPDRADEPLFRFRMGLLHEVSGVTAPLRNFAILVRRIAARQPLPEYSLELARNAEGDEIVTLYRDKRKSGRASSRLGVPALPAAGGE